MRRRNFVVGAGLAALLGGAVYFGMRGVPEKYDNVFNSDESSIGRRDLVTSKPSEPNKSLSYEREVNSSLASKPVSSQSSYLDEQDLPSVERTGGRSLFSWLDGIVSEGERLFQERGDEKRTDLENVNVHEAPVKNLLGLLDNEDSTSFIEETQRVIQPGIDPATGLPPENPVEIHDAWAGLADLGYSSYSTGSSEGNFTSCSQTLYDAVTMAYASNGKLSFEDTLPDGRYDIIINSPDGDAGLGMEMLREKLREEFGIRGENITEEVPAYSVYADASFLERLGDDFDGSAYEMHPEYDGTECGGTRYVINGTLEEIVEHLNNVFSTNIVGSGSYDDRNLYHLEFFCEGCKYGRDDETEIKSILEGRGFIFEETTSEIERVRIYVDEAEDSD